MITITLEGKEYQLDVEQAKKLNLLKEKDSRVISWEEFVKNMTVFVDIHIVLQLT